MEKEQRCVVYSWSVCGADAGLDVMIGKTELKERTWCVLSRSRWFVEENKRGYLKELVSHCSALTLHTVVQQF